MNKALIYGNLTRDPELKALPSGAQVAPLVLLPIAYGATKRATSRSRQSSTMLLSLVARQRPARNTSRRAAQHLSKGASRLAAGRAQRRASSTALRSWQTVLSLGHAVEEVAQPWEVHQSGPMSDAEAPQKAPKEDAIDYPQEDINPDDIPF
jgi:single-strand DNA-binding protein